MVGEGVALTGVEGHDLGKLRANQALELKSEIYVDKINEAVSL